VVQNFKDHSSFILETIPGKFRAKKYHFSLYDVL